MSKIHTNQPVRNRGGCFEFAVVRLYRIGHSDLKEEGRVLARPERPLPGVLGIVLLDVVRYSRDRARGNGVVDEILAS